MQDNQVVLVGNLTRDIEARNLPSGVDVAEFGLAVNNRKQVDGEWVDDPNFFDCSAFGSLAVNAIKSLGKGDRVVVVGRLRWSSWVDKDTQKNRSKVTIMVDEVSPSLRWATATPTRNPKGEGSTPGRTDWDDDTEPF